MYRNPYMPQPDLFIDNTDENLNKLTNPSELKLCKTFVDVSEILVMYLLWEAEKPTKWIIHFKNREKVDFGLRSGQKIFEALQQFKAQV